MTARTRIIEEHKKPIAVVNFIVTALEKTEVQIKCPDNQPAMTKSASKAIKRAIPITILSFFNVNFLNSTIFLNMALGM